MTREELFRQAFGGSSPVFLTIPIGREKEEREIHYGDISIKKDELSEYTEGDKKVYSDFGTEVVFPVYFEAGDYWSGRDVLAKHQQFPEVKISNNTLLDAINSVESTNTFVRKVRARVKMEEFRLPNATMVDFSRSKNITKTPMYEGSVKEIFGFDDWQIRIRMLCVAEKSRGMTGQEIAHEVIKWTQLADCIKVSGKLFNSKEIYSIAIDKVDIKSIEGAPDTVAIELDCISDEAFEIIYNPPKVYFHNDKKLSDFMTMINNLDLEQ